MRQSLSLWIGMLAAWPATAASTLVWVESQEASSAALTEELQALAGPTDLLRLLTGRQTAPDLAGQALSAARLAWRQVRIDALNATLKQAEQALLANPRRGDAGRLAEVFCYRAAAHAMNFQTDEARAALTQAIVLGQKSLSPDLSNTLGDLWNEIKAKPGPTVELSLRTTPGARLWLDDIPLDQTTMPSVAFGWHLVGATQTGRHPVWSWLRVNETGGRATLLPQAPAQLAPITNQLGKAARGDRNAADAARRSLGVDGLVLCTMTLVASRYDVRCTLNTGAADAPSAVASFLPGEPLQAHAKRLWEGLSAPQAMTIVPGDGASTTAQASTARLLGWTSLSLGVGSLATAGWATVRTASLHNDFRDTAQGAAQISDLQSQGNQHALIADTTLGVGIILSATGAYLLRRAAQQQRAFDALAGGQP